MAGLALVAVPSGAGAESPGGPTGIAPAPPPAPGIGDLVVTPAGGLVDRQQVVVTASAQGGGTDVAYSYYVSLCAGAATEVTGDCVPLAGPLWPAGGRVSVSVALPAVVARGGGRPAVDCRTVPVCTVVAFPYRSTELALAPVSFSRSEAPAARPPDAVTATPRYTA